MNMSSLTHVVVFSATGRDDRTLHDALAGVTGTRPTMRATSTLPDTAASPSSIDLAVLDVRADNRLPAGVPAFKRRHPETPLMLVCASLDPELMLDAMRAGITECVDRKSTRLNSSHT